MWFMKAESNKTIEKILNKISWANYKKTKTPNLLGALCTLVTSIGFKPITS